MRRAVSCPEPQPPAHVGDGFERHRTGSAVAELLAERAQHVAAGAFPAWDGHRAGDGSAFTAAVLARCSAFFPLLLRSGCCESSEGGFASSPTIALAEHGEVVHRALGHDSITRISIPSASAAISAST